MVQRHILKLRITGVVRVNFPWLQLALSLIQSKYATAPGKPKTLILVTI